MTEFPRYRSRVSFPFLVHVVLAFCIISAALPLHAYAQEVVSSNEYRVEDDGNQIDVNESPTDHQTDPIITNASPVVEKTPPLKQFARNPPPITTGASTIQWRARLLKGGCANAVSEYLRRIHEDRKPVEDAVSQARKELNAARLHKPQNVLSAEQHLNATKQSVSAFDEKTLQLFGGSVPKTCISEVVDRMGLSDQELQLNSAYQVIMFLYRTFSAHLQAFYLTLKGVWNYTVESYIPVLKDFQGFADVYYKKAVKLYNEAHPKPSVLSKIAGKHKPVPTSEFAIKIMKGLAYACVPLMLMAFIALMVILLFPILLFGVILPDFIYHVWIRLFIFYYPYAMVFPADFIIEMQNLFASVLTRNWRECWETLLRVVMGAVTDFHELYYNTVIMGQMVWFVSFILMASMWRWLWIFVIRKKRTKRNPVNVESVRRNRNKSKPKEKSKNQ